MSVKETGNQPLKKLRTGFAVGLLLVVMSVVLAMPMTAMERGDAPRTTQPAVENSQPFFGSDSWVSTIWSQLLSWLDSSSNITATATSTTTCDPADPLCSEPTGSGETTTEGGGTTTSGDDGGDFGGGLDVGG